MIVDEADVEAHVQLITKTTKAAMRVLLGKGELVQIVVMADLLAMWIAWHHPAERAEAREMFNGLVEKLILDNEQTMFEMLGGKPEGWEPN